MPDTCDLHLKLSRADFSTHGLGDKHFRIEADHGNVLEIYREYNERGEELRELLDANGVVYLGSHGSGADYGCAVFASDGERSAEVETDRDGTYLVPVDKEGVVVEHDLAWLREFIEFRKGVAGKLGLCPCCELSPIKCRSSGR